MKTIAPFKLETCILQHYTALSCNSQSKFQSAISQNMYDAVEHKKRQHDPQNKSNYCYDPDNHSIPLSC